LTTIDPLRGSGFSTPFAD